MCKSDMVKQQINKKSLELLFYISILVTQGWGWEHLEVRDRQPQVAHFSIYC